MKEGRGAESERARERWRQGEREGVFVRWAANVNQL